MIVWLPSYPRSGNTLLRTLLKQVFDLGTHSKYNDPSDLGADPRIASAVGHLTYDGSWNDELARMRNSDDLRLVKTHEGPAGDEPAIFIVRHGWSASISNQHYLRDFSKIEAPLPQVIAGTTDGFPSWGRMLDLWDPFNRPHTLLIRYEDLVNAPQEIISAIHSFLNVPVIAEWQNNFEEMRRLNPKFFRSGKVEISEETFGHDNATLFASLHGDWMNRLGYAKDNDPKPILCRMLRSLIECNPAIEETADNLSDHIDTLRGQLDQLATTAQQQTDHIAVLERERDRLAVLTAQYSGDIAHLASTAKAQTDHIAVLEQEHDRLAVLTAQYSGDIAHLASTAKAQIDHIAVLEQERNRLAARETQLTGETAHYLKVMDEQLRYIKILEAERSQASSPKS
jgi:hypothetical protein